MIVAILADIDDDLRDLLRCSVDLSGYLQGCCQEFRCGEDVAKLYITLLCKSALTGRPLEEILGIQYNERSKQVDCDVYLDYEAVVSATTPEQLQAMVVREILDSMEPAFSVLQLSDFDLPAFQAALQEAFAQLSVTAVDLCKVQGNEQEAKVNASVSAVLIPYQAVGTTAAARVAALFAAMGDKLGITKLDVAMKRKLAVFAVVIVAVVFGLGIWHFYSTAGGAPVSSEAVACKERGDAYWSQGQLEQAIAAYTEALRISPQYAKAYYSRGCVYASKGQSDQAIADYTAVLRIDAQDADAYYNRGNVYANKGQMDRAISDYTKALRVNSQLAFAYDGRGIAYAHGGHFEQALADFNEALRLNPQAADTYYNRGNVYMQKAQPDQAIVEYNKALQLNPQLAFVYNGRGNADAKKGQLDQALADYNEALQLNSQYADAYFNKGMVSEKLGHRSEAVEAYRQFLHYASPKDSSQIRWAKQRISVLGG